MRSRFVSIVFTVMLATAFSTVSQLHAQATDPFTGEIVGEQFLALGPFANPFACSNIQDDLLGNHIAPSLLQLQYPEEGDEVDYDPALAVTTGYHDLAPRSGDLPIWRRWDDGSPLDGDQAMEADVAIGINLDDHVTFLATYVEYDGDDPTQVDICARSDDGLQVWWDCTLAINNNVCRGRGVAGQCQDLVTIDVEPGIHRLIIGVWERGGGWGGSLRLIDTATQQTIDEGSPDWIYLGIDPEGSEAPDDCQVCTRVLLDPCQYGCADDGELFVELTWENPDQPDTCEGIEEIAILVNGQVVDTVGPEETEYTITEDLIGGAGGLVGVDNGGIGIATCLVAPPGNVAPSGFATQSSQLGSFGPELAIDGNLANFTHTLSGQSPAVWELDLGDILPIQAIVLHNRTSCCGSRLRDIVVSILEDPADEPIFESELLNPENEMGVFPSGPPQLIIDLNDLEGGPIEGQIVRVTRMPDDDLSGTGGQGNLDEAQVLSLGEVEVVVDACGGDGPGPDEICDNEADDDDDGLVDCDDDDCPPCPVSGFVRGDPNSNGTIDLTDGILILNFLFLGGPEPVCADSADVDDNGAVALTDAVRVFGFLFLGGDAPAPPSPAGTVPLAEECGPDPTDDDPLDCADRGATCQ